MLNLAIITIYYNQNTIRFSLYSENSYWKSCLHFMLFGKPIIPLVNNLHVSPFYETAHLWLPTEYSRY